MMQDRNNSSADFIVNINQDAAKESLTIVFRSELHDTVSLELYTLVGEMKKRMLVDDRRTERLSMDIHDIQNGHYLLVIRHAEDLVTKPVHIDRGS